MKPLNQELSPHDQAHEYWKNCACTFLASDPEYYNRQELALRRLLGNLDCSAGSALDVGCGNGRFSMVIADFVQQVFAFDLSNNLIHQAQKSATQAKKQTYYSRK